MCLGKARTRAALLCRSRHSLLPLFFLSLPAHFARLTKTHFLAFLARFHSGDTESICRRLPFSLSPPYPIPSFRTIASFRCR